MNLNPSAFLDGVNNMAAGAVLKLPGYVGTEGTEVDTDPTEAATAPAAGTINTGKASPPVDFDPVVAPAPEKPLEPSSTGEKKPNSALETGIRDEPAGSGERRPLLRTSRKPMPC